MHITPLLFPLFHNPVIWVLLKFLFPSATTTITTLLLFPSTTTTTTATTTTLLHEIKTNGYDVIGVHIFLPLLNSVHPILIIIR